MKIMAKNKSEQPKNIANLSEVKTSLPEIERKKLELELKKIEFWDKRFEESIPKILNYFEQKMLKHETPILKTSIRVFAGIVILIILGTGFLVYVEKLDAASFTFVIGAVLGYLVAFSKAFWKKEGD